MRDLFRVAGVIAMVLVLIVPVALAQTAKPGWQEEWEKVLAAAKKEGTVSVWGPPGTWARTILVDEFQSKYPQIGVEFHGSSGSKGWPKLQAEREAGLFTVDVHIGGVGTAAGAIYKAKAQQPLESAFILPELMDKKAWWQGRYHFGDPEGKFVLVFSIGPTPALAYNPKTFDPKTLKSYKDLLDPTLRGKVVMVDPRTAGPGNARWHFYVEAMGREFVERLAKQVVLTRDHRQSVEWVASGKYPVGTGLSDVHVEEFVKKGAPVAQISNLAEGNYLSAGWGTVNFMDRAPHPNAAKVFINWLLSKEGQLAWQKHSGYNSGRIDISKESVDRSNLMVEGIKYYEQFTVEAVRKRDEVSTKLAREIIKD